MKLSDDFLSTFQSETEDSSSSATDYFRPKSVEPGKPAIFALCEEDPCEWYLVWGTPVAGGKNKPFRFLEKPSDDDIELELGKAYTRALNYEKTDTDKIYQCLTFPIFNWELGVVQVFEIPQFSINKQFSAIATEKVYKNKLLDFDFKLEKELTGGITKYHLRVIPRDEEEHDDLVMQKEWKRVQKAGFDLNRLLTDGNPFRES
ncbi:hypothetical protein [uncultured Mediterranean phage uvMED]|nr:hypothetical protein [uncultured Mediterranean phage uvMED]BAQ93322.1 hypothetical protein [uncultured Mediterranean phage uvMED]BAR24624.1 hypothetical protein [uncultured Mediterranean phage uvMED]